MDESKSILQQFEKLLNLVCVLKNEGTRSIAQLQTVSGEVLFSIKTQNILLFPSRLERVLHEKLAVISKHLKKERLRTRKDTTKSLIETATMRLARKAPFLRFSGVDGSDETKIAVLFKDLSMKGEYPNKGDKEAIWDYWSTQAFREPLQKFLRELVKILDKRPQPKQRSNTLVFVANPFKLGNTPKAVEMVAELYYELRANGFLTGGNVKAFVDLFSGKEVNIKVKFDFRFKFKCHLYYLLVALADEQDTIIFPRNRKYRGKRRHTKIPWTFLNLYVTNFGEPVAGIQTNCNEKGIRKTLPAYLNHFVEILRKREG